jgi:hypothetical protein
MNASCCYDPLICRLRDSPVTSRLDLALRKMLLLRWGQRADQSGVPLDPLLVTYQRCPANPFIFSETELEVFPGGLQVAIELDAGQNEHQIHLVGRLEVSFDGIQELLIFLTGWIPTEMGNETTFCRLIKNLKHFAFSSMNGLDEMGKMQRTGTQLAQSGCRVRPPMVHWMQFQQGACPWKGSR